MSTSTSKGFTLVEALVATLVIGVGLVAVLSLFPLTARSNKSAEQTSLASTVAKAKLEDLVSTSYDELTVGTIEPLTAVTTNSTSPLYGFKRQTAVTLLDSTLHTTNTDVGLKQITVTVSWPAKGGGTNTFAISTIRSRR